MMKLRKKQVFIGLTLLVLVGSLLFFFQYTHHQRGHTGLRPGWKLIATFHGEGSTIITKQRLALPHLWGYALDCSGEAVQIILSGVRRQIDMGKQPCSAPSPAGEGAPQSIEYDLFASTFSILSISANSTTTWQIAFVQQEKPSTFYLDSGWMGIMRMSSASGPIEGEIDSLAPAQRIWGLVGVCVGTGTISATVFPGSKLVTFPACDEYPRLMVVRYASPTRAHKVEVRPSSENSLLSTVVVVCVNEEHCGLAPESTAT